MQRTCLLQDLVNGSLNGFLFCYIGLQCENLVWIFLCYFSELIARLANVDAVDCFGPVGETAVCYSETDSWLLVNVCIMTVVLEANRVLESDLGMEFLGSVL